MQEQLKGTFNKVKEMWATVSMRKRIAILSLLGLSIVMFFSFFYYINQPNMKVLYSNLGPEDTNRVVNTLQAENVPYELGEGGKTILIPEEQVYDMRIKIAGEGTLVGSGIGFEVFDEIKVGQTDFVQQVNYQRALQGELSRTIAEFPNVESARVHLVVPRRSLFIEEQQEPSVSVVLRLQDKFKKMTEKEIGGIVNMLTMAIEGLDRSHISITDSMGKALFVPDEDGISALTATQREHKLRVEKDLERRLDELLYPVFGPGKVIAKIDATLDFSQRTIRRELFDPESAVIRSEQTSEETNIGRANLESGSPDVNFRGDGIGGALTSQEGTRETKTSNYEINKEEHSVVSQLGEISRLTIAVAVDGTYATNEAGDMVYVPRTEAEIAQIKNLVANAVGFDASRGDSIEVSTMAFGSTALPENLTNAQVLAQYLETFGKPALFALLALLFLVIVVRPIVLAFVRPKVEAGEMLEGLEGLPSAEEQIALYEAQESAAHEAEKAARMALAASIDGEDEYDDYDDDELGTLKHLEDVKLHTLQLAEVNFEQSLLILRNWMRDESQQSPARA